MTTKTTGWEDDHLKTVVTNNSADVATHNLDEGCAHEPMYKHRNSYDGIRSERPADYDDGMEVGING